MKLREKYEAEVKQFVKVCHALAADKYVTGYGGNLAWKLLLGFSSKPNVPRLERRRKSLRDNGGVSLGTNCGGISIMNKNDCTYRGKVIHPPRIRYGEVDASVAHRGTKIIVPIGAMQTITFVEVHHIWHIR